MLRCFLSVRTFETVKGHLLGCDIIDKCIGATVDLGEKVQPHSCQMYPVWTPKCISKYLACSFPEIKQQNWSPAQCEDDHDSN